jgi:phospholipid/cholesterol/gamma-HCH transport system substrate-binding protein
MSPAMRRRLVALLILGLVVVGVLGARALTHTEPIKVAALFDSTVGLYPGSDVQVLGVPVGTVTKVSAEGENVRVTMELDPDQPVAADTKAVIIAPTMVSDRFVQLTDPWTRSSGGAKLNSGTVIDRDRTAVPVEIDDLYAGLKDVADALGPKGANKNGALSRLLEVGAENLDGQGEKLNTMVGEFGKASATLSNVDENFFSMLVNLDKLNKMLVANDGAVSEVSTQFADVAGFLADDREDMGRAAKNLAGAMAVLDDFIRKNRADLETSVDQLVPTAKALRKHQESLDQMIKLAPLLLHNLEDAYDPDYGVIAARGNVNEVSLWSNDGLTARTSDKAPPTLLGGDTEGERR